MEILNNINIFITSTYIIPITTPPIQYGDNQGKLELLTPRSDNSQQLRCLGEAEVVVLRTVRMIPVEMTMRRVEDDDDDNKSRDDDSPEVTQ